MVPVRDHQMMAVLGGLPVVLVPHVFRASVVRRASIGVLLADLEAMCLDDLSLLMFEAVLVQVIDVIAVTNSRMPASWSVTMCHDPAPFNASAWLGACISRSRVSRPHQRAGHIGSKGRFVTLNRALLELDDRGKCDARTEIFAQSRKM